MRALALVPLVVMLAGTAAASAAVSFHVVGDDLAPEGALGVRAREGMLDLTQANGTTLRWTHGAIWMVNYTEKDALIIAVTPTEKTVGNWSGAIGPGAVADLRCGDSCFVFARPLEGGAIGVDGSWRGPMGVTTQRTFADARSGDGKDAYHAAFPAGLLNVTGATGSRANGTGALELVVTGAQLTLTLDGHAQPLDTRETIAPVVGAAPQAAYGRSKSFLVLDLEDATLDAGEGAAMLAPAADFSLTGSLSLRGSGNGTAGTATLDVQRGLAMSGGFAGRLVSNVVAPLTADHVNVGAAGLVSMDVSGVADSLRVDGNAVGVASAAAPLGSSAARLTLAALALLATALLARHALAAPFYSRISRATVLANENRQRVLALLSAKPGLTATEVAREAGLARVVAQHHLRMLVVHKMLVAKPHGRSVAFAPPERVNEGAATDAGWLLRDASRARIAEALAQARGPRTQMELAGLTGLSRRLVAHHLQRMETAGLVRREGGMPQRYAAGPALAPVAPRTGTTR